MLNMLQRVCEIAADQHDERAKNGGRMMDLQKKKPVRSKKYLEWVKTLDCVYSGMPADDAHHIIGVGEGGVGTKASDLFVYPVTRGEHMKTHQIPERWPDQWEHVSKTLQEAVRQGVLVFDNTAMK